MKNIDAAIIVLLFIWSVLAGFFAFTDLNISKAIINPYSGWAIFLEQYGELPGLIIITVGIILYSLQINYTLKMKLIFVSSVFILGGSATLLYFLFVVFRNATGSDLFFYHNLTPIALISLAFFTMMITVGRKSKIKLDESTKIVSKMIVGLVFYGYLILNQLVKFIWGRVRFRELDILYSNFTEWYVPNGLNGYQSFPSGHAAMGWMLLPLILLIINKNIFIKSLTIGVITIWALFVAASRVVIGAHYASDVLFGSCFIILVFLVLSKNYFKQLK